MYEASASFQFSSPVGVRGLLFRDVTTSQTVHDLTSCQNAVNKVINRK